MIIFYAAQRYLWEFLKPYPAVLGPLNLFHLLMMGLVPGMPHFAFLSLGGVSAAGAWWLLRREKLAEIEIRNDGPVYDDEGVGRVVSRRVARAARRAPAGR